MESDKQILQKNLVNFIIHDVFNAISYDEILQVKSPKLWICEGKALGEQQIKSLRSEAEMLEQLPLWRYFRKDVMWHAQRMLVNKSRSNEDLISGKMLLYWISVADARFKSIKTGKEEGVLQKIKES